MLNENLFDKEIKENLFGKGQDNVTHKIFPKAISFPIRQLGY